MTIDQFKSHLETFNFRELEIGLYGKPHGTFKRKLERHFNKLEEIKKDFETVGLQVEIKANKSS